MTSRPRSRSAAHSTGAASRTIPEQGVVTPRTSTTSPVTEAPRRDIVGYVEEVVDGPEAPVLKGWAFDRANPADHVVLVAYLDTHVGPQFTCDVPRPDLAAAGFPRVDCGFLWPVPQGLADAPPTEFGVRTPDGSALILLQPQEAFSLLWRRPPAAEPPAQPTPELPDQPGKKALAPLARGKQKVALPDQSPLFDAPYYLAENADALKDGELAWEHFLRIGAAEMRNPNLLFDIQYYRDANPDFDDREENPLLHFERIGRAEGWAHHWLFSGAEYLRLNPDLPTGVDGLQHMLAHGLVENRQPSALFDPAYYLSQSPDVALAGIPALKHFLQSGDKELRAPHPLFDSAFYAASAGPLEGMGALEHFLRTGSDGQPHALFDPAFYKSAHILPGNSPQALLHYIREGGRLGYDPTPLFDTRFYLQGSPEREAQANPLAHYVTVGRKLGRSPHPLFLPGYYVEQPPRRSWNNRRLPLTGPVISVIVPVFNTPAKVLAECIESVLRQTYASWELCIVDDGSRSPGTASTLASYRNRDARIRIDRTTANLHIARATNRAVMQASGEFLVFLDHDDTLEPEALAEVAAALEEFPDIDLLYTDEDKIDLQGNPTEPYYKPDWSPEHLHSVMYVLHMLTVRKSLFWAVGGSRPERTGAQDFDLALRVARKARRVHHIPRILYHWRMMAGSAAGDLDAKPYAIEAGRAALQDAVEAEGLDAEVVPGLLQGTFRVRPKLSPPPPVSLMILTNDIGRDVEGRGPMNLVRNFVSSIVEKSTYKNYRIVIVDDANSSAETKSLAKSVGASIVSYKAKGAFNYARKANFATKAATTEHVIHLNDDMEVISPEWIEALLESSTRDEVGAVGGRLLYPNGRIQHAGVILGVNEATGHAFLNLERDVVGYNAYTHLIRNYSAITGAVFATRKAVLEEVGGYDERLAIDYNDIDLCLRIGRTGRRIVYTPYCELFHFEGSSAKRTEANPKERALFLERWSDLVARDPFYNPNLPRDRLGFA